MQEVATGKDNVLVPVERAIKLQEIVQRIKRRDHLLEDCARSNWLKNGRDLLEAKHLLGHGHFESWCSDELSYSKSKAEKLMRAAVVFGPHLESVTITDLPPPTLAYQLSAPSIPQEIKDAFIPRVIAGDWKKAGAELWHVLKQHRENVKQEKKQAARSPDAKAALQRRKAAEAQRGAREAEERRAERQRDEARRSSISEAAAALIHAKFGDALPELLELASEEFCGVLAPSVLSALRKRVAAANLSGDSSTSLTSS